MTRGAAFRTACRFAVVVSAVLLSWVSSARAQRITGELSGTVTDVLGGLVPGADVALTHEASHATRASIAPRPRPPTRTAGGPSLAWT
jgi:hypothetical protein